MTYDPSEPRVPAGQPGGGQWTNDFGVHPAIKAFEEKHVNDKVEYAHAVDKNGRVIVDEVRGAKDHVTMPFGEKLKLMNNDAVYSHIHPMSKDGVEGGGSFSNPDIAFAVGLNLKEIRAVDRQYIYRLVRLKDRWPPIEQVLSQHTLAMNHGYHDIRDKPFYSLADAHNAEREIWHKSVEHLADTFPDQIKYVRIKRD
jgi:hypothetical protein